MTKFQNQKKVEKSVIARSEATKQSPRISYGGLLRFARNDGRGVFCKTGLLDLFPSPGNARVVNASRGPIFGINHYLFPLLGLKQDGGEKTRVPFLIESHPA